MEPIDRVEWRPVDDLNPSAYNPNVVARQELKLLEHSIAASGWLFPILVNRDGFIIDGHHRAALAKTSKAIRARNGGEVPCVVLDVDLPTAMAITVRMNRAKGTHVAVRMGDLVKALINEHGWTRERVGQEIGAHLDEVDLLYQDGIFKARKLDSKPYSKAWVPGENGAAA